MKEVIVISKAHLDLGFTDFAQNVKRKYLQDFIPCAIDLADKLNTGEQDKKFVWTLGSWLIKEALDSGDDVLKSKVEKALKDGNLAPHALPFTTHTELLDEDLLEYGLSIVDRLDAISGSKTIAAKMTDVPGHTAAIVPALAKHGIKLLHVGVNGAAAMPQVGECFVWKYQDYEVVVIYDAGYGGVFAIPYTDTVLYFDHAHDNGGVRRQGRVVKNLAKIQAQYPDYKVRAGRLDDVAQEVWKVKDKLPVYEGEIGDTWIHGVASDPYKTAAMRTLCRLKDKWLQEGSMRKDSEEYRRFADCLLCVAEHTWGLDMKTHLADTENYLKADFAKARKQDVVKIKNPFGAFPFSFLSWVDNTFGKKSYRYSAMEKSWAEQRNYIDNAIKALEQNHAQQAVKALEILRPAQMPSTDYDKEYEFGNRIDYGDYSMSVNESGGITLLHNGKTILNAKNSAILSYRSYGASDYDYWSEHYMRSHVKWAVHDYLRPSLCRYDSYPQGEFDYKAKRAVYSQDDDGAEVSVDMSCDKILCDELGAPHKVKIVYTLSKNGLGVRIVWTDKDAVRTTESIAAHLYPCSDKITYVKTGKRISPDNVVAGGNRKLSVIEKAEFEVEQAKYSMSSVQAALVASDGGNILRFDDKSADSCAGGLSYILYDNVWGTNFPLWYEENAFFEFELREQK
ncbi:MAG: DUF5054 domain-containing protein [Christensenellales bacterium]